MKWHRTYFNVGGSMTLRNINGWLNVIASGKNSLKWWNSSFKFYLWLYCVTCWLLLIFRYSTFLFQFLLIASNLYISWKCLVIIFEAKFEDTQQGPLEISKMENLQQHLTAFSCWALHLKYSQSCKHYWPESFGRSIEFLCFYFIIIDLIHIL